MDLYHLTIVTLAFTGWTILASMIVKCTMNAHRRPQTPKQQTPPPPPPLPVSIVYNPGGAYQLAVDHEFYDRTENV